MCPCACSLVIDGASRGAPTTPARAVTNYGVSSYTHEVANFAAKREDTLAQEERWRNKMMRRLGDKFDHIDARIDGLSERFEHLASEIQENLRGMRVASA